ncbi:MAG: hypothetical protein ACHQ03_10020, partial [Candidatus Bathyarchaeia archaeon]
MHHRKVLNLLRHSGHNCLLCKSLNTQTKINGGGSIPVELVFLAPAVSSGFPKPCDPISAWALALRLLSSEPHRV